MCFFYVFMAGDVKVGDKFHVDCRKSFVNRKRIKAPGTINPDVSSVKTRSLSSGATSFTEKFDYRTCCLYCSQKICDRVDDKDGREIIKPLNMMKVSTDKNDKDSISFVKSKNRFNESIKEQLKGRLDEWACEVRGRVESVSCLRAEEAVYHRRCYRYFTERRKRPGLDEDEI